MRRVGAWERVMKLVILTSAMLASLLAISAADAATVVASASFETPVLNTPGIQYGSDESSYNTNETGPVSIPQFSFKGFSGIISNGSLGVFPDTAFGNQAAFLQSYLGGGSEIDWTLTGLTAGRNYTLSFEDVSSLIVPDEPFTISALGGGPSLFTPGSAYALNTFSFTPTSSSDTIAFVGAVLPGNQASAIDNLTVSGVPESATWAMLLLGAGLVGGGLRMARRKDGLALAPA